MPPRTPIQLLGLDITPHLLSDWASLTPLTPEEMKKVENVAAMLQQQKLPELINQYDSNMDRLAFYAYLACGYKLISITQLATLLEVRAIKNIDPSVTLEIEKINAETMALTLPTSITRYYIADLYSDRRLTMDDIDTHFVHNLSQQINPDAYCIKFTVPNAVLPANQRFLGAISLARLVKAISVVAPAENTTQFSWLSAGARETLTKLVYKEHAKHQQFFHGTGITREKILAGEEERARFAVASVPGIEKVTAFHEIESPEFLVILHDELHRQIISAIPNPIYHATLRLVEQLRIMAGRPWSPEIWHLTDMDFALDRLTFGEPIDVKKLNLTELFVNLLSESDLEGKPLDIFLLSPYCDTSWMILLDMVLHKPEWEKLGIHPEKLPEPLKEMHDFLYDHLEEALPLPVQLLKLKCEFLQIPFPEGDIGFSKRAKTPVPIEILVNGQPYPFRKSTLFFLPTKLRLSLHTNPVMREIQAFARTLPPKKRDILFEKIDTIIMMTDLFPSDSVNEASIRIIFSFLMKLIADAGLSLFTLEIASGTVPVGLTPAILDEYTTDCPQKAFHFITSYPSTMVRFVTALKSVDLSLHDLQDFDNKALYNLLDFQKKQLGQYLDLIKSQPRTTRLFLLSHFVTLDSLFDSTTPEALGRLLNENSPGLEAILRSDDISFRLLLKSEKMDLTTFIEKFQPYFADEFLQKFSRGHTLCLTILLEIGNQRLISLENFFKFDKTVRLQIYEDWDKIFAYCSGRQIGLQEYVEQRLQPSPTPSSSLTTPLPFFNPIITEPAESSKPELSRKGPSDNAGPKT